MGKRGTLHGILALTMFVMPSFHFLFATKINFSSIPCVASPRGEEEERDNYKFGYYLCIKDYISVNASLKGAFDVYAYRLRHKRPIYLSIVDNEHGIQGKGCIPVGETVGTVHYDVPLACAEQCLNAATIIVRGEDGVLPTAITTARMCFADANYIYGVTTDNPREQCLHPSLAAPFSTLSQVNAIQHLQGKNIMTRLVFDLPTVEPSDAYVDNASWYVDCVKAFASVSKVMACLVDSYAMTILTLDQVKERTRKYLEALGEEVHVWEIGNEINGDWLEAPEKRIVLGKGAPHVKYDAFPQTGKAFDKAYAMYAAVKEAKKKAAITFYYARNYQAIPDFEYEMFHWIDAKMPENMREGMDYVWLSYYEDQSDNGTLNYSEMDEVFQKLRDRFPNAKLGIGECGWGRSEERVPKSETERAELIRRFYGYRCPLHDFVGGCFYWHFRQTMVPKEGECMTPDWQVFNGLMK